MDIKRYLVDTDIHFVDVSKLKEADYNPRQISKEHFQDIKKSLKKLGCIDPILINKNKERENIIVGGHMRLRAMKELGEKKIPCIYLDMPLEVEKEANIRLNKNTGEFDYDLLANHFDFDDLLDFGFTEIELVPEIDLENDSTDDEKKKEQAPGVIAKMVIQFNTPEDLQRAETSIAEIISEYKAKYTLC